MSAHNARSISSTVLKCFGEFFREMAVLIAVFAPLDRIVQGNPLTTWFVLATMSAVAGLLGVGIAIEVVLKVKNR